jgi:hypothetical protein
MRYFEDAFALCMRNIYAEVIEIMNIIPQRLHAGRLEQAKSAFIVELFKSYLLLSPQEKLQIHAKLSDRSQYSTPEEWVFVWNVLYELDIWWQSWLSQSGKDPNENEAAYLQEDLIKELTERQRVLSENWMSGMVEISNV